MHVPQFNNIHQVPRLTTGFNYIINFNMPPVNDRQNALFEYTINPMHTH